MPASLLHAGQRLPLNAALTLGRAEDNDIELNDERVSRHHARISPTATGFEVVDLGSRNGTYVNGEQLIDARRDLVPGDSIAIGEAMLRFLGGVETQIASRQEVVSDVHHVVFDRDRLGFGRDESNDVVLGDPNVSRFHAEVVRTAGGAELVDLGSRNGTRLNGEPTPRARLEMGAEIGIGPYRLVFDGDSFLARDDHGALRLDAVGVGVRVKTKTILEPTSLSITPGELVAIIGESGTGKTTLLKALAGANRPTAGRVTLNGEDLFARLTDIGYVPQDEIVHRLLTVREGLGYAARLRLPSDISSAEIDEAVARVLSEVALVMHAETRIGSLSGGERKRAGLAAELLGRPSVLFLDEPTTGLDPGLETQMMQLFRELSRGGRAIALVTHATKNLALCDRVVVMARGGIVAFDGRPDGALRFFDVAEYDGIYTALPQRPAAEWRAHFQTTDHKAAHQTEQAPPAQPATTRAKPKRWVQQAALLVSRYLKLFTRDRRNLLLLLGQPPLLALFAVILFEGGVFEAGHNPGDAVNLLFLMAITVIWLGAIDSAPEIVKERAVLERESAIGVRIAGYMTSKLVILLGLVALQTVVFAAVLLLFRPLNEPISSYVTVTGLLAATGVAAVSMGLLISAAVRTQEQATSLIPLAVIPQLLFAGAIVPLQGMGAIAKVVSQVVFAQWSVAGIGTAVDMNARLAADEEFAQASRFGTDFFDLAAGPALAIQLAFAVAFLAGTAVLLHRSLKI